MKLNVTVILAAIGGFIASAFGGWSESMTTLLIFMMVDYVTGMIVAGVFHRSGKTENGGLESKAGWTGLCRKGMTFVIVLIAARLDIVLGTSFARDAVVIGFICNETLSILENAGLMGLRYPAVITKALEVLAKKADVAPMTPVEAEPKEDETNGED